MRASARSSRRAWAGDERRRRQPSEIRRLAQRHIIMDMNRRAFLAGTAATLAGFPAIGRAQSTAITPGQHDLKLGDADRDGLLYIPRGYQADHAAPLMVMLH